MNLLVCFSGSNTNCEINTILNFFKLFIEQYQLEDGLCDNMNRKKIGLHVLKSFRELLS